MQQAAEGLLKKFRLLRRKAPRNDKERAFLVIASDPKDRAAISNRRFTPF